MRLLKLRNALACATTALQGGRAARGQSMVEVALVLPLLVILLSVVIEGGLALNAWIRVNTAARDATRFSVDAGRPNEVVGLVLNKLAGIEFGAGRNYTLSNQVNIYIITGKTNAYGSIPADASHWGVDHRYGGRPSGPNVTRAAIEARLQSQGITNAANVPFKIVEVDFTYTPLLSTLFARDQKLSMTSFAFIQQY